MTHTWHWKRNEATNQLDNGSTTDTKQWCELHLGHCNDVIPVRRHFEDPGRQDEIFMACQRCVRDLQKAELIRDSKYAKLPCVEVLVPWDIGRQLEFSVRQQRIEPRERSFEVTLDALQVKYLRALGLRVIPA